MISCHAYVHAGSPPYSLPQTYHFTPNTGSKIEIRDGAREVPAGATPTSPARTFFNNPVIIAEPKVAQFEHKSNCPDPHLIDMQCSEAVRKECSGAKGFPRSTVMASPNSPEPIAERERELSLGSVY
jgi:hypothetical protein